MKQTADRDKKEPKGVCMKCGRVAPDSIICDDCFYALLRADAAKR